MTNKSYLRKKFLKIRDEISIELRNTKSINILKKLVETTEYKNSKTIGFYLSFKSEVNTEIMIKRALEDNKNVLIPKIINSSNKMEFTQINFDYKNNLIKNKLGLYELESNNFISKNTIDTIIVPLVVFDDKNNRVGYGKGFYDRYLENFNGNTIGLGFIEQKSLEIIKINSFDIKIKLMLFN